MLTASLARTSATRAHHHEAALTAPRATFPTELPARRRGATKSHTRDLRTCAGVRRRPRNEPAAGSSRRRVAGGAGEGRSRAGLRARGVPTPHRARRHDARASLQHAHARLHDASIVHPRARFPLAGGAARRTHAAPPACLRYQGVAIETARRDSSRGARLRPTVRCCQGHRRRAPRLFVGRSHAHPVGTILAYVVCWACLYSAQRAKSMPCVSCSECVRVQYPLAASRCSCSLSRRKVASREGSNYACILFTIVRMHASTLSSIAYACIPLKSSITRYRTTHSFGRNQNPGAKLRGGG